METSHQIPPRLGSPPTNAGRIGLSLSLVAPVTITLMVLLHPG